MEIINLHIFKMVGFIDRLKQIIHQPCIWNHRAARIHQQHQLYGIFPRTHHFDLQISAIITGLVNRRVNVKLRLWNVKLCGKLAKPPKRHLELPVVNYFVITEILVFSCADYGKRRLITRRTAYAYTAHISARVSKLCLSHCSNPKIAAVVLLILVFETLLKFLLNVILIHMDFLNLIKPVLLLLVQKRAHLRLIQPRKHVFTDLVFAHNALKAFLKRHIKFVKFRLAFDQNHARHIIKLCQRAFAKPLVKRVLKRQPLAERHVKTFIL